MGQGQLCLCGDFSSSNPRRLGFNTLSETEPQEDQGYCVLQHCVPACEQQESRGTGDPQVHLRPKPSPAPPGMVQLSALRARSKASGCQCPHASGKQVPGQDVRFWAVYIRTFSPSSNRLHYQEGRLGLVRTMEQCPEGSRCFRCFCRRNFL